MIRVTAIIPVFNGGATIRAAIDSVLAQRGVEPIEVIAVDDGSTDDTAALLATYGERIRIVTQANRGLAAARNAGSGLARGAYLAFLDADDVWQPAKIARLSAVLDQDEAAALAYSDVILVDDRGIATGQPYIDPACAYAPSMAELLARWWPILPSTVMMRRGTFEACGGFCERYRRAYEDVEMWLRARERGHFIFVAEPLVRYRVTPISERMRKYEADYAVFTGRIAERYGRGANGLLHATRRAYASALGADGLTALRGGDRPAARRALISALRYDLWHWRNVFRLARTLLPPRLARMLSGRSGRGRAAPRAHPVNHPS
jgi:glycosyltransferase involved in cell wall biosynthesis